MAAATVAGLFVHALVLARTLRRPTLSRKAFVRRPFLTVRLVQVLAVLLVCKTTVSVLLGFRDYFPPDFRSDFLLGRRTYFFGPYQWAFYAHIISGPITLVTGMVLISDSARHRSH